MVSGFWDLKDWWLKGLGCRNPGLKDTQLKVLGPGLAVQGLDFKVAGRSGLGGLSGFTLRQRSSPANIQYQLYGGMLLIISCMTTYTKTLGCIVVWSMRAVQDFYHKQ